MQIKMRLVINVRNGNFLPLQGDFWDDRLPPSAGWVLRGFGVFALIIPRDG